MGSRRAWRAIGLVATLVAFCTWTGAARAQEAAGDDQTSPSPAGPQGEAAPGEPGKPHEQDDDAPGRFVFGFFQGDEGSRAASQAQPAEMGLELEPPPEPYELETKVGGALRFNVFFKTWPEPTTIRSTGDNVSFDTFRLDVNSSYGPLKLSAEYRFYAGYNMLKKGYLAYQAADVANIMLGVVQVPFGILPYASHNWFFDLSYYVGLEDDADTGVRVDFDLGMVDVMVAFFANSEGNYSGDSIDSARYSYDVVRTDETEIPQLAATGPRGNEERDQGNVRVTLTLDHGDVGSTEIGLSGEIGQLHNHTIDENGPHWAAAAHVKGRYGPFDVMLEGARYGFDPALAPGQDDRWVVMGAYDAPYRVAAQAYLLLANLGYRLAVDWGPVESLTFYEDYSVLFKTATGYATTHQSVTGMLLHAGPLYVYLDAIVGKHHPWVGPSYVDALAEGGTNTWEARFNANVGYYF